MATIAGAVTAGLLEEFRLPDHEGRDPLRPLYLAAGLFDWIDETDELYEEDWSKESGGRSMAEHLAQTFCDFRCAKRPLVGDLRRVQPTKKGIWKIHSPGLRIVGWVPFPHAFVAVKGAFVSDTHGPPAKMDQLVSDVLAFAQRHKLSETIKMGDSRALFPQTA
jgi:hypothetical protein